MLKVGITVSSNGLRPHLKSWPRAEQQSIGLEYQFDCRVVEKEKITLTSFIYDDPCFGGHIQCIVSSGAWPHSKLPLPSRPAEAKFSKTPMNRLLLAIFSGCRSLKL